MMLTVKRSVRVSQLSALLAAVSTLAIGLIAITLGRIAGLSIQDDGIRKLAYDVAVGYLLSYGFYVLVVVVPERARRRRTKSWLLARFRNFKLHCIEIYLSAIGEAWDSELPESLLDPARFRDYFSARHSPDQTRWHAVHNGLYDYGVPQLIVECEVFSREIQFALAKLDVEDDLVTHYLSRLSANLVRLRTSATGYDDIKHLLNFLYPLHSHWTWLDGEPGLDPIGAMIARI